MLRDRIGKGQKMFIAVILPRRGGAKSLHFSCSPPLRSRSIL